MAAGRKLSMPLIVSCAMAERPPPITAASPKSISLSIFTLPASRIPICAPPAIFAATVAVVSMLAVEEFFSLSIKKGIGRPGRWFLLAIAAVSMSFLGGPVWVLGAAVFAAIMLMTIEMLTAPAEDA